jgi:hypothetical protein
VGNPALCGDSKKLLNTSYAEKMTRTFALSSVSRRIMSSFRWYRCESRMSEYFMPHHSIPFRDVHISCVPRTYLKQHDFHRLPVEIFCPNETSRVNSHPGNRPAKSGTHAAV